MIEGIAQAVPFFVLAPALRRRAFVILSGVVKSSGSIFDACCQPRPGAIVRVMADIDDWAPRRAPTLADIEALADASFATLPEKFTRLCEGVVFRVEDFPDEETLADMACESDFDLLGLFRGRGLIEGEYLAETGAQPNMVWLYRRPILDFWAESEDTLGDIVTHVLVHEIGHHFGLSDEDMEEIERRAGEGADE